MSPNQSTRQTKTFREAEVMLVRFIHFFGPFNNILTVTTSCAIQRQIETFVGQVNKQMDKKKSIRIEV